MLSFPKISLLITHYNRSESLENLLKSFQKINCVFGEIVVSDDGSLPKHLDVLKHLSEVYQFKLVTAPKNKGLGNNINKGQMAVSNELTLYIQEDFVPSADFPNQLLLAQEYMQNDMSLDLVRFYAYFRYPYLKKFTANFDEMYIPKFAINYNKIYLYSDHPHLRRSTFLEKFGKYPEGIKGDLTEYKMCISFIQNKGKAIFYKDYANLFLQKNSEDEPSTMTRSNWKHKKNIFIKIIRDTYRQIKYNLDIRTMKPLK